MYIVHVKFEINIMIARHIVTDNYHICVNDWYLFLWASRNFVFFIIYYSDMSI